MAQGFPSPGRGSQMLVSLLQPKPGPQSTPLAQGEPLAGRAAHFWLAGSHHVDPPHWLSWLQG
jgi:hypothetical protein